MMLEILLERRIRRLELMFLFMSEQVFNGSMTEAQQNSLGKLVQELVKEFEHENAVVERMKNGGRG